jgi:hypothetical protein
MPEPKPNPIATILLIPLEGDPLGLLADGVCGERPPTLLHPLIQSWDECAPHFRECPMVDSLCGRHSKHQSRSRDECMDFGACRAFTPQWALVIAFEGKPVRAGVMRLRIDDWLRLRWRTRSVWDLLKGMNRSARSTAWESFGTLVMLDADGNEVKDG